MFDDDVEEKAEPLIARLRSLEPIAGRRSSEQLCYAAGVRAGQRQVRVWRATTAVSALAVATLWVGRAFPAGPAVVGRVPLDSVAPSLPDAAAVTRVRNEDLGETDRHLTQLVLTSGWDALPPPPSGGPGSTDVRPIASQF